MARVATVKNVAVAIVTASMALVTLGGAIHEGMRARRSRVGTRAPSMSALLDLSGRRQLLTAADSLTLVVFLRATCQACRLEARSTPSLVAWGHLQNLAVRIVVDDQSNAARQFGRLAKDTSIIAVGQHSLYEALGIDHLPTTLLIDRRGVVRARWVGQWPSRLAVLNVVSRYDPEGRRAVRRDYLSAR